MCNFNREDGTRAKDSQYALIDYLNPDDSRFSGGDARNEQAVGDEFSGKPFLAFSATSRTTTASCRIHGS